MKNVETPRLLNERSPARIGDRPSEPSPAKSAIARRANCSASAIQYTSEKTVASRQPGESQFTWYTQLRARSFANASAYHVDPAYRPWECPDHQQIRTDRARSLRRSCRARATSSSVASPVALSPTPACHE